MDTVYILLELGDVWDGGDEVLGVFSSVVDALAAVPGSTWYAWGSEPRDPDTGLFPGPMRDDVTAENPPPPGGWSHLESRLNRGRSDYRIEPWRLGEVQRQIK